MFEQILVRALRYYIRVAMITLCILKNRLALDFTSCFKKKGIPKKTAFLIPRISIPLLRYLK